MKASTAISDEPFLSFPSPNTPSLETGPSSGSKADFSPSLWGVFDIAWTSITSYHADEFRYVSGVTPLSTLTGALAVCACYVVVVFGGREVMRNREPFKLRTLFKIHNLFLAIWSGVLLALFIEQLAPSLWQKGLYQNICGPEGWTDKLVTLYYLNYITKYVELMDTVFLMLKKKPLTFLHTYHHPATAILCYTQLAGATSISWVPITLNLMVHVVMYWYYFQSARGIKTWWKEWITRLQIAQFVIDLSFVYFAIWDFHASTYWPWLPHYGKLQCKGNGFAAWSGCAILSSYLVLFIIFYIRTYRKALRRRDAKARAAAFDKENNLFFIDEGQEFHHHHYSSEKKYTTGYSRPVTIGYKRIPNWE